VSVGGLNLVPVSDGPTCELCKWWLVKGSAEVSELVGGGGLDPLRVEVAADQSIALRPSKRVGEDLVGDGRPLLVNGHSPGQASDQGVRQRDAAAHGM